MGEAASKPAKAGPPWWRVAAAAVFLALLVVALWLGSPPAEEASRGPMVGQRAPKIADEVEFWVNGEEVELGDLKGQPVLLYFWHPRDDKSLETLGRVNRLAGELAEGGLVTIGLCVLDEPAEAEPLVSQHGLTFRIALDCDADIHFAYRIDKTGTPYCYLVDGERTVAWEGPPDQLTARRIRALLPSRR